MSNAPENSHNTSWLPTGLVLEGRWKIEGQLGRGGFATVYRGRHVKLEREVAIKVLDIQATPEELKIFEERFLREAKLAANLDHPNIVQVLDFGVTTQHGLRKPFLVMELLNGHDLETELLQHGPLNKLRAQTLFHQALDALNTCHEKGIVHRDLKPSNLFISYPNSSRERMLILDFGIARAFEDPDSKLTATSHFTGTPAYLAPEYISDQHVSPAIDVYQMGLIISEALTGTPVVQATAPLAYLMAHCNGQQHIHPALLHTEVGKILSDAVQVNPQHRPISAGHLQQLLEHADWHSVPTVFAAEELTKSIDELELTPTQDGVNPWGDTFAGSAHPTAQQRTPQQDIQTDPTSFDGSSTDVIAQPPQTHSKPLIFIAGIFALGVLLGGSALLITALKTESNQQPETSTPVATKTITPPVEQPKENPSQAPAPAKKTEPVQVKEQPTATIIKDVKPPTTRPTTSRKTVIKEPFELLTLTPIDIKFQVYYSTFLAMTCNVTPTYYAIKRQVNDKGIEEAAQSPTFFLEVSDDYQRAHKNLTRLVNKPPQIKAWDSHSNTLAEVMHDLTDIAQRSYTYRMQRDSSLKLPGKLETLILEWDNLMQRYTPTHQTWYAMAVEQEISHLSDKLAQTSSKTSPLMHHYYAALLASAQTRLALLKGSRGGASTFLKKLKAHARALRKFDLATQAKQLESAERNSIHATIIALDRMHGHFETYMDKLKKLSKKSDYKSKHNLAIATSRVDMAYSSTMKKHYGRRGFDD